MLEQPKIELKSLQAVSEKDKFVLHVRVFNPEQRTVYAYATPRRILYDNNTHKLTLWMHDQHIEPDSILAYHLPQPRIVPLEAAVESEIKVSLPQVMNRIRSASERGPEGKLTEQLRIGEAQEVSLEIAHQDTPFYYNPKIENARQLKEWGSAISKATFRLDAGGKGTPGKRAL
jgi:hypothetical protein